MIAAIIPIGEFSKLHEVEDLINSLRDTIKKDIADLEPVPRHRISTESFMLARMDWQLKQLDMIHSKLKSLSEAGNAGFATHKEVESKISASQPYNAGSRENY